MRLHILLAAITLFSASLGARADTITDFNFQSALDNGSTAQGTIVIDTTSGVVENSDFDLSDDGVTEANFSSPDFQESLWGNAYLAQFQDSANGNTYELLLPTASLVGYLGGNVCAESEPCDGYPSGALLASGADSGAVGGSLSSTPEPSTLLLLGTGVLAIYIIRRHRTVGDKRS